MILIREGPKCSTNASELKGILPESFGLRDDPVRRAVNPDGQSAATRFEACLTCYMLKSLWSLSVRAPQNGVTRAGEDLTTYVK